MFDSYQLKTATNGQKLLHLWRTGGEYQQQKGALLEREFNNILFSELPQMPQSRLLHLDLRTEPLPFEENSFDAIYANHVIEHMFLEEALFSLREIRRVLKKGGVLRVTVPDLEAPAKAYIQAIENYDQEESSNNLKGVQWFAIEILDQLTREVSGGKVLEIIKRGNPDWDPYTIGYKDVLHEHFKSASKSKNVSNLDSITKKSANRASRHRTIKYLNPINLLTAIRQKLKWRRYGNQVRQILLRNQSSFYNALEIERARHDEITICNLLQYVGFLDIHVETPSTSGILDWSKYNLDISDKTGRPIDPSCTIEARA